MLQNDIGTTDAHVLVIHVTGRTVTVTYTAAHLSRLLFFQSLFEVYEVQWQDTRSRKDAGMEDGVYHLCVGNCTARSVAQLRDYLGLRGSRLVFLIDRNRAQALADVCSAQRLPSSCSSWRLMATSITWAGSRPAASS